MTVAALYLLSSGRVPPPWGAFWNRHHVLIAFSTYLRAPSAQVPSPLILAQASHWPPGGVTSRSPLQCEWIKRFCDTQRKNSRSRTHERAPDNFARITTGARTLKGHYHGRKRLRNSYRFMRVGDFKTSVFFCVCMCAFDRAGWKWCKARRCCPARARWRVCRTFSECHCNVSAFPLLISISSSENWQASSGRLQATTVE